MFAVEYEDMIFAVEYEHKIFIGLDCTEALEQKQTLMIFYNR